MKAGVCVWMCECNHSHLRCRVLIQLPVWRLTVAAQWYPVWPGSLCPPPPFPSPSQCCRCYITLPSAFSFSRVQHFLLLRAVFKVLFSPRGFHVELIFLTLAPYSQTLDWYRCVCVVLQDDGAMRVNLFSFLFFLNSSCGKSSLNVKKANH